MVAAVKDTDRGLKALLARMAATKGATVLVGVFERAGDHRSDDPAAAPVSVAQVAAWNEYGTSTIPARPAIRNGLEGGKVQIGKAFDAAAKAILDGKPVQQALGVVGLLGQALIRRSITATFSPPNSPRTIAAKGSDHPLIDSGQYRQSIDFEVKER